MKIIHYFYVAFITFAFTYTFAIFAKATDFFSHIQEVSCMHLLLAYSDVPDDRNPDTNPDNFVDVHYKSFSILDNKSDYPMQNEMYNPNNKTYFGTDNNPSKPIKSACRGYGLYMIAQPDVLMFDDEGNAMMRLVVCNRTSKTVAMHGSTSDCLPIAQEALEEDGVWKPITICQTYLCSRTDYTTFLKPDRYWEFAVPRFKGTFKTKIRFYCRGLPEWKSNEFDGSINPDQFSEKPL